LSYTRKSTKNHNLLVEYRSTIVPIFFVFFVTKREYRRKNRSKNSQASIIISNLATITTPNSSAKQKDNPFKETVERQNLQSKKQIEQYYRDRKLETLTQKGRHIRARTNSPEDRVSPV
jgi:hypothetical protein